MTTSPTYLLSASSLIASKTMLPQSTAEGQELSALSPGIFDFVQPLHELMSRVLLSEIVDTDPAVDAMLSAAPPYPNSQPLPITQLAAEVSLVKIKLAKARDVIAGLPDVSRSAPAQIEEMQELRDRIQKQKAILTDLRRT